MMSRSAECVARATATPPATLLRTASAATAGRWPTLSRLR